MCQLAKRASRQPPQAAGEEEDASLDSTGRRALAMKLMVPEAGRGCTCSRSPSLLVREEEEQGRKRSQYSIWTFFSDTAILKEVSPSNLGESREIA